MTGKKVEDLLRREACRRAVPVLNGLVAPRPSRTQSDRGLEVLWDEGYIPASKYLIEAGVPERQVRTEMAKVKALLDIVEPSDLIAFPQNLHDELDKYFSAEISKEPPLTRLRLDERVVKLISEFRVEMWSNESQHAGRPHVKVHLKNGAISISLDPEPENLTPRGGLTGEATALKVIKKHRKKLLKLWQETRPDTQKLTKFPESGPKPAKKNGPKSTSRSKRRHN
jgi:hypothetical protein